MADAAQQCADAAPHGAGAAAGVALQLALPRVAAGAAAGLARRRRRRGRVGITEQPAALTCRICWDEGGELFAPCSCAGTLRWVHPACLERSRAATADATRCQCCGAAYRLGFHANTGGAVAAYTSAALDECARWVYSLSSHMAAGLLCEQAVAWSFQVLRVVPFHAARQLPNPDAHPFVPFLLILAELDWPRPEWADAIRRCAQLGMGWVRFTALYTGAAACGAQAAGVFVQWATHWGLERLFGISGRAERYPLPPDHETTPANGAKAALQMQAAQSLAWYLHPGWSASTLLALSQPTVSDAFFQGLQDSWAHGMLYVRDHCERDWLLFGRGAAARRASRAVQRVIITARAVGHELVSWVCALSLLAVPTVAMSVVESVTAVTAVENENAPKAGRLARLTQVVVSRVFSAALGGAAFHWVASALANCCGQQIKQLPLQEYIFSGGSVQQRMVHHVWLALRAMLEHSTGSPLNYVVQHLPTTADGAYDEVAQVGWRISNDVSLRRTPLGIRPAGA